MLWNLRHLAETEYYRISDAAIIKSCVGSNSEGPVRSECKQTMFVRCHYKFFDSYFTKLQQA